MANNVVVYANNQAFYDGTHLPAAAPFDTLVIAFVYPSGITNPSPDYFSSTFSLVDWGGTMSSTTQTFLQGFQGVAGNEVWMSVGGSGGPTVPGSTLEAMYTAWGANLSGFTAMLNQWISQASLQYGVNIAGIDFDYEYFLAGENAAATEARCTLLANLSGAAKATTPPLKVSHAPQIPYVTSNTYGGNTGIVGVYVGVLNRLASQSDVDFLSVQVYNNPAFTSTATSLGGATPANSYFPSNSWANLAAGTTQQVIEGSGAIVTLTAPWPLSKLAFGLPLEEADAGSGYLPLVPGPAYYQAPPFSTPLTYNGVLGTALMFWQISVTTGTVASRWDAVSAYSAAVACLTPGTLVQDAATRAWVRVDALRPQGHAVVAVDCHTGEETVAEVVPVSRRVPGRTAVWATPDGTLGLSKDHCVVVPEGHPWAEACVCPCAKCRPVDVPGCVSTLAGHGAWDEESFGAPQEVKGAWWWHVVPVDPTRPIVVCVTHGVAVEPFRTPLKAVLRAGWSNAAAPPSPPSPQSTVAHA
jgi:hypothetical protein